MPAPEDVLVIGTGIVGASVAWHLVQQGARVTIISNDSGGTATADSFAWLNATWRNPRSYYDFRRQSMQAWKGLAHDVPELDRYVRWCSALQWDLPAAEREQYATNHRAWGYDIGRIGRDAIHAREPHLSATALPEWGLQIGEEGTVEASLAAVVLISDAQARGAAHLCSGTVARLVKEKGRITGVVLESREYLEADHVVCAAGVESARLCATADVAVPVTGSAGLLVHSKPVAERVLNGLVLAPDVHMRQTVDGRIVAGAGFAGSDPGADPEKTAAELFTHVQRMFADPNAVERDFHTVGIRPMPADGLPIVGATGVDGLSVAVMHSGVTLAPVVGELLADEIVHGTTHPALRPYRLGRFTAG